MSKPKKKPTPGALGIRLPADLTSRLDALVAKRTAARPHLPATRSELIREALELLLARESNAAP